MKKVAVILSGCGVFDGSEIHESVLTLLALSKAGVKYQCLAPNMEQRKVVNHLNQKTEKQKRNVLEEAARIARGDILDIAQANPRDYDAMIFPGGFGAALNISDFAIAGDRCTVQEDVLKFAKALSKEGKPAGFICISPAIVSKIYGEGVRLTIGNDPATAKTLEAMGAVHVNCPVEEIVFDTEHNVVTTPAYMLAKSVAEASLGIENLVQKVLSLM